VHRMLELVDLASPTHDEVRRLVEAAAEEEIPLLAVPSDAGRTGGTA
jgi:hypothetical protein